MKYITLFVFSFLTLTACNQENKYASNTSNTDTQEEEWIDLFDGSSFENWRGYLSETVPEEWTIEDGAMVFTPAGRGGQNIISKAQFTDFVLSLEWKIAEGGNSGIFWGVYENPKYGEAYQTGPEIQVLDNERHPDAKVNGKLHQAGALYDMIEPSQDVVKPAGQWNSCVISIDYTNNLGSVKLNDTEIVSFPLRGEAWEELVNNSKFKDWEGFGAYKTGHIAFQDHGDKVWYRNVKIKKLNGDQEPDAPEETEKWVPEPKPIAFDKNNVPSDAIVLFDGTNLDAWESTKTPGNKAEWTLNKDGSMTVKPGTGDIQTKATFGSVQLHLEWKAPKIVEGEGQGRGNSGVFFQNKYEVQILDSYQNRTYSNGQATAIYKQHIPLANATKPPTEWQTYDIIFHAPEFDGSGNKIKSGSFTVIHNGVLVQDHVEILGSTEYIGNPKNEAHKKDIIKLQDHSNPVSYRNIWLREL